MHQLSLLNAEQSIAQEVAEEVDAVRAQPRLAAPARTKPKAPSGVIIRRKAK